jgi:hypothetical protein
MKLHTILRAEGPWLNLMIGPLPAVEDLWRSWEQESSQLVFRQVRGSKMHTKQGLFDEFAAAWQFPSYFGENWAALDECLADLSWAPAAAHVLGIRSGVQTLKEEAAETRRTFWSLLKNIASPTKPSENGASAPRPFRVVVQCVDHEEAQLRHMLLDAGMSLDQQSVRVETLSASVH